MGPCKKVGFGRLRQIPFHCSLISRVPRRLSPFAPKLFLEGQVLGGASGDVHRNTLLRILKEIADFPSRFWDLLWMCKHVPGIGLLRFRSFSRQ